MKCDYFLKIDGVEGESHDAKHKGEIDIESWSWGENQTGTHAAGGGGGAGKVNMHDFHFLMKMNKASPKLFLACACGEHFKNAVLTCRKAGGRQEEFLKITMTDLRVSSYGMGIPRGVIPADQISLNFAKIQFEYREEKPDGSLAAAVRTGWNLKENRMV